MEFTAKEIKRQATRIEEEVVHFDNSVNLIIRALSDMQNIVRSEDSNLAHTIELYQNSYEDIHGNIKREFKQLAQKMHSYADRTIANEENISEDVSNLNAAVNNVTEEVPPIFNPFE